MIRSRVSWFRFPLLLVTILGGGLSAGACDSDDAGGSTGGDAGQSAAGAAVGGDGPDEGSGAGAPGAGGADSAAGAGRGAGGSSDGRAGETAAAGAGGSASEAADCFVKLSMNTSNASDADTPLSEVCEAVSFDGQINFGVTNGAGATLRNINIDFFDEPVAGKSVKLEDGYSFENGMGAAASYMDSVGVWNADSGTVSIDSVTDDGYVVRLENVHFVVLDGPVDVANSGAFVANGTITAAAKPAK